MLDTTLNTRYEYEYANDHEYEYNYELSEIKNKKNRNLFKQKKKLVPIDVTNRYETAASGAATWQAVL